MIVDFAVFNIGRGRSDDFDDFALFCFNISLVPLQRL